MTKGELPLAVAEVLAESLRSVLLSRADAFSRLEVAGSIRRRRPVVGDIELVGEIDPGRDLGSTDRVRATLIRNDIVRAGPTIRKNGVHVAAPWGDRYLKGAMLASSAINAETTPVQVDLFIVRPPADWGVDFLIRTGSAKFSQAVVTRLHKYGLQSHHGHIIKGSVHDGTPGSTQFVPCPDEETFFRLAHMPFVPPEHREVGDPVAMEAFMEGT